MERIKRLYAEGFGKGQIPQPSVAFVHRVLPGLHVAVGTRQGTEEGTVFPSVDPHAPLLSPVQVRLALFAQVLKIRRRWVQDRRYERRWTPVFAFWKGERHVRGDNEQPFANNCSRRKSCWGTNWWMYWKKCRSKRNGTGGPSVATDIPGTRRRSSRFARW